ncbi:flagellar basal-body rod protein FlgG [Desulfurobacterium pacificum]|uniref:Flagellar basal-body rod protein FlgG n=1 Tax=Desulfurobacterium pacificum TaxID=240166 RepID=A0ABY1NMF0_9BACT|nr:flagellar basal-body rod protein FlgF [Desulfurobacterium pacificum]SMP13554.1 flagellar basal-body rod protein FlgG [Desulfurobacterium pacificum]
MSVALQSLYVLASGGERALEQLDVTANNIANVNTPGFKKIFEEEMSQHIPNNKGDAYNLLIFPRFKATHVILTQGALKKTGNPLDLALKGEGFFAVKTKTGEVYTRNGHFFLSPDGRLIDANGNPVLSIDDQEIILNPDKPVTVTKDGVIYQGNERVAVLKIVNFQKIAPLGSSYYKGQGTPQATDAAVLQGYLESSNVDPVKEMVALIEAQRRFEMYGNLIRGLDRLNEKSNEIGRV